MKERLICEKCRADITDLIPFSKEYKENRIVCNNCGFVTLLMYITKEKMSPVVKIWAFLISFLLISCSSVELDFNAELKTGMHKAEVIKLMKDMPQRILDRSDGSIYVYHFYSPWIGFSSEIGTRYIVFDRRGMLKSWYGWGFCNGGDKK